MLYEVITLTSTEEVLLNGMPVNMAWCAPGYLVVAFLDQGLQVRITSYNVCYTKLLRFQLQRREGLVGVQPRAKETHQQPQPVRELITADFPTGKLILVQGGLNPLGGESLVGHPLQGRQDQLLDRFEMLRNNFV